MVRILLLTSPFDAHLYRYHSDNMDCGTLYTRPKQASSRVERSSPTWDNCIEHGSRVDRMSIGAEQPSSGCMRSSMWQGMGIRLCRLQLNVL